MSAMLFKTILPDEAIVFRMGGDEFTMILPGCPIDRAQEYVSKLLSEQEHYRIMDRSLSVSYGVSSMQSGDGNDVKRYLEDADKQMYKAKNDFKAARQEDKK